MHQPQQPHGQGVQQQRMINQQQNFQAGGHHEENIPTNQVNLPPPVQFQPWGYQQQGGMEVNPQGGGQQRDRLVHDRYRQEG